MTNVRSFPTTNRSRRTRTETRGAGAFLGGGTQKQMRAARTSPTETERGHVSSFSLSLSLAKHGHRLVVLLFLAGRRILCQSVRMHGIPDGGAMLCCHSQEKTNKTQEQTVNACDGCGVHAWLSHSFPRLCWLLLVSSSRFRSGPRQPCGRRDTPTTEHRQRKKNEIKNMSAAPPHRDTKDGKTSKPSSNSGRKRALRKRRRPARTLAATTSKAKRPRRGKEKKRVCRPLTTPAVRLLDIPIEMLFRVGQACGRGGLLALRSCCRRVYADLKPLVQATVIDPAIAVCQANGWYRKGFDGLCTVILAGKPGAAAAMCGSPTLQRKVELGLSALVVCLAEVCQASDEAISDCGDDDDRDSRDAVVQAQERLRHIPFCLGTEPSVLLMACVANTTNAASVARLICVPNLTAAQYDECVLSACSARQHNMARRLIEFRPAVFGKDEEDSAAGASDASAVHSVLRLLRTKELWHARRWLERERDLFRPGSVASKQILRMFGFALETTPTNNVQFMPMYGEVLRILRLLDGGLVEFVSVDKLRFYLRLGILVGRPQKTGLYQLMSCAHQTEEGDYDCYCGDHQAGQGDYPCSPTCMALLADVIHFAFVVGNLPIIHDLMLRVEIGIMRKAMGPFGPYMALNFGTTLRKPPPPPVRSSSSSVVGTDEEPMRVQRHRGGRWWTLPFPECCSSDSDAGVVSEEEDGDRTPSAWECDDDEPVSPSAAVVLQEQRKRRNHSTHPLQPKPLPDPPLPADDRHLCGWVVVPLPRGLPSDANMPEALKKLPISWQRSMGQAPAGDLFEIRARIMGNVLGSGLARRAMAAAIRIYGPFHHSVWRLRVYTANHYAGTGNPPASMAFPSLNSELNRKHIFVGMIRALMVATNHIAFHLELTLLKETTYKCVTRQRDDPSRRYQTLCQTMHWLRRLQLRIASDMKAVGLFALSTSTQNHIGRVCEQMFKLLTEVEGAPPTVMGTYFAELREGRLHCYEGWHRKRDEVKHWFLQYAKRQPHASTGYLFVACSLLWSLWPYDCVFWSDEEDLVLLDRL
jgi:hypothetical protein